MAIDLKPGPNAAINFGDIAAIGGATALSIVFTVFINAVTNERRFVGQDQAFYTALTSGGKLGFLIHPPNYGFRTSSAIFSAGNLYRCVMTWDSALPDGASMRFWVNGVEYGRQTWVAGPNPAGIPNSSSTVAVGRVGSTDGVDVLTSEVAIWGIVVPDWFAVAYGNGYSPKFLRSGGILYSNLVNTDHLIDEWGGAPATNVNGANAPHPRVYYPAPSPQLPFGFVPPPTVAPHIDDATISVKRVQDDSISVGAGAATISVKRAEDKTI